MRDKEFLQWIHDRLHQVHDENLNADYMWKLRAIINGTNSEKVTPNVGGSIEVRDERVSFQDILDYFYQDADEACKKLSDLFVARVLDVGFDSSVDLKLRGCVALWALANPGDDAGEKAEDVFNILEQKSWEGEAT